MKKVFLSIFIISLLFITSFLMTGCVKKVTVSFDTNGGSEISQQKIEKGGKVEKPADPIKEGYTFEGWYVDEEKWNFIGYVVTDDTALVAHWTCDLNYTINNNEVTITGLNTEKEEIVILESYEGYKTKTIGDNAFQGSNLKSVKISNGVTSVGSGTFDNCANLKTITIPSSVKRIGFNDCPSLEEIIFEGTKDEWSSTSFYSFGIRAKVICCSDGNVCIKHMWDYGSISKLPTEDEEGEIKYTCTNCGQTKVQTLAKIKTYKVPAGGYDGSKVEIKFYHTMGQNLSTVLEKYITEFNKTYPNIIVNHEQVGGYDDVRNQISTELTVGNQPNIAYCYPDHVALYNLPGAVVTLDNLIDDPNIGLTAEQKADFIEGYYNEGRQFGNGLMYSMPFSKSTEVLYYNETFFTEKNLNVPDHWFSTSDMDTTSMEYVCKKIKEIDPTSIPLGYDSEANLFITMCEQCGSDYTSAIGGHYRFNNETNKNFVKVLKEWYQNGWITTQSLYGAYTSGLFVAETGTRSYMSIGSSAGATHQRPAKVIIKDPNGSEKSVYPFNVGIASIPQMNPNRPRVISQGPSVCIFNNTGGSSITDQQIVASWLFVRYLVTSVEFQAEFSMASGYVPVLKSVAENPVYKAFTEKANGGDNIAALSAKVCLAQESAYFTPPAFNGSSKASEQVGKIIVNVLKSKEADVDETIEKAFEDAIAQCDY